MTLPSWLSDLARFANPFRTALNILLCFAIAVLVAKTAWALLAPNFSNIEFSERPLPVPLAIDSGRKVVDHTVLYKYNLFAQQSAKIAAEVDAPETNLNIGLVGLIVRPGSTGDGVAYIKQANNQIERFVPGDMIINGTELKRIESDHVVLLRNGAEEILWRRENGELNVLQTEKAFQETSSDENTTLAKMPSIKEEAISSTREKFAAVVNVNVSRGQNGGPRFVVSPKGSLADLEALGFKTGDVVSRIDGIEADNFDLEDLPDIVLTTNALRISIVRDGSEIDKTIRFE